MTAAAKGNVAAAENLIKQDDRFTVKVLAESVDTCSLSGSVHKNLT